HQHGQEIESQRVKAMDGVTTALELEIGVPDVGEFLRAQEGHSLIHYGTAASHCAARAAVFGTPIPSHAGDSRQGTLEVLPRAVSRLILLRQLNNWKPFGSGWGMSLTPVRSRLAWAFNTHLERLVTK